MKGYFTKRIVFALLSVFVISFIYFMLFAAIPGDPAMNEVMHYRGLVSDEEFNELYAQARQRLGLDLPLMQRYARWLSSTLKGDIGYSTYYKQNALDVIKTPLLTTLLLNGTAFIIAISSSIPLGIYFARIKGSALDTLSQVIFMVIYSLPSFILGLLLLYIFSVKLMLLPMSASGGIAGYIIPVSVLALSSIATLQKYIRASVFDTMGEQYIKTARGKGLKESRVFFLHAWPNARIPSVTVIINQAVRIFGGSLIVENLFLINGLGRLFYTSLMNQDWELAVAASMLYAVAALIGGFCADWMYGKLDPRVRLSGGDAFGNS